MTFSTTWPWNLRFDLGDEHESINESEKKFQSKVDEIDVLHLIVALLKKNIIWLWNLILDFAIFLKMLKDILLISGGYAS